MNRKMRLLGIIALLFFLSGCSSYRTIGNRDSGIGMEGRLQDLQAGDVVKLVPISGPEIKGSVRDVGPESLTIALANPHVWHNEKDGEGEILEFAYQDLHSIEVQNEDINKEALTVVVIGSIVVIAGYVISAHAVHEAMWGWAQSSKSEGPILSGNPTRGALP